MSVADEFAGRRRRYLVMMTIRGFCVIGAASTYRISGWIAALFMVGALALPWIAVLVANDRPPKQDVQFRRFVPGTTVSPPELAAPGRDQRAKSDGTNRQRPFPGPAAPRSGTSSSIIDI